LPFTQRGAGQGDEGIFLATASRITKAAAVGDAVPGGGVCLKFARIRFRR